MLTNILQQVFKRGESSVQQYTVIISVVLYCFKKKNPENLPNKLPCNVALAVIYHVLGIKINSKLPCCWLTMKKELEVPGKMSIHRDKLPLSE